MIWAETGCQNFSKFGEHIGRDFVALLNLDAVIDPTICQCALRGDPKAFGLGGGNRDWNEFKTVVVDAISDELWHVGFSNEPGFGGIACFTVRNMRDFYQLVKWRIEINLGPVLG